MDRIVKCGNCDRLFTSDAAVFAHKRGCLSIGDVEFTASLLAEHKRKEDQREEARKRHEEAQAKKRIVFADWWFYRGLARDAAEWCAKKGIKNRRILNSWLNAGVVPKRYEDSVRSFVGRFA
jgi:hypothetical protein